MSAVHELQDFSSERSPEEWMEAELRWLDVLIHREILRLRAAYRLSLDEFRGLYVSDEQVDALVRASLLEQGEAPPDFEAAARAARITCQTESPLQRLSTEFGLSALEQDLLLVAVAPELDPKYETLYAYLNNDVTRKFATADLMMRLLRSDEVSKLAVREVLQPRSVLFASGLLCAMTAPRGAWLSAAMQAHPSLANVLLGIGVADLGEHARWLPRARLPRLQSLPLSVQAIAMTARAWRTDASAPVWLLRGRDTVNLETAAQGFAAQLGLNFLQVDLSALTRDSTHPGDELAAALRNALLQQRFWNAVLYIAGGAKYLDAEGHPTSEFAAALRLLAKAGRPVLIGGEALEYLKDALAPCHVIAVEVPDPAYEERVTAWQRALQSHGLAAPQRDLERVSHAFSLTHRQIDIAAQEVADSASEVVNEQVLAAAARNASDQSLAAIAQRLEHRHALPDVIVPPATARRLQDIVHAVRDRHRVFSEWGLARGANGAGLRVLFAGPSGTGKTMAAGAIACELGLDVYRIDISKTVSKYIGETEKNLDRIFGAALHSNAMLFFDEADALFGKRSEVKDAHDRYSNIETAYLLQKIEDYPGIVLLASNLSRNMDTAYLRRLHFVVEFPLPEKNDRERLWRNMLGGGVPLAEDIDFHFLAAQFAISGGEIRNVVLDAAFLAAQSEPRAVAMRHLIVALGRQLTKQGRVPSVTEFKQHHALLSS